jgi:hypothetical protein
MNEDGFRQYLENSKAPKNKIEPRIAIAKKFEDFLKASDRLENPTAENLLAFSEKMVEEELNTYDNYAGLVLYGRFLKNNNINNTFIALLDGDEVMDNLEKKIEAELGKEHSDAVFVGIELPPLGTPTRHDPKVTQIVMERLENTFGTKTTIELIKDCLRDLGGPRYDADRKKYLESKNFDEFLVKKGEDFIAQLENIKQEDGVFFTQKITDNVIQYVDSHPEIRQGLREGDILYEAKIPYMTIEYLAETDETMKRYYYCHCPWARDSLIRDDVQISPTFCNCSAGFHKKYWEGVLDQPLKAEVLETVLDGDMWCKFAIHLPEGL